MVARAFPLTPPPQLGSRLYPIHPRARELPTSSVATATRTTGRSATALVYSENEFGKIDGKVANGLVRHSGKYDIVGLTGMNVQKERMKEILLELRKRKIFTVVGGPYASVKEEYFDDVTELAHERTAA